MADESVPLLVLREEILPVLETPEVQLFAHAVIFVEDLGYKACFVHVGNNVSVYFEEDGAEHHPESVTQSKKGVENHLETTFRRGADIGPDPETSSRYKNIGSSL